MRTRGFTLIEMAIVLIILGLLLGGVMTPLSAQIDRQNYMQVEKDLSEIKEALLGFLIINNRLPCPASIQTNGVALSACSGGNQGGFIPWVTLGTAVTDPWKNHYRYRVDGAFTTAPNFNSVGTIRICDTLAGGTCKSLPALSLATEIPVVIYCTGKNGTMPTSDEEIENLTSTDGNTVFSGSNLPEFISRDVNLDNFDDVVIWVSTPVIIHELFSANKLPT